MCLRTMVATSAMIMVIAGTARAADLIVNGDFEGGNAGFASGYTFGDVHFGGANGSYNIVASPAAAPGAWPDWLEYGDHTTGSGLMMVLNGPAAQTNVPAWSETLSVVPGTNYSFTFWLATVNDAAIIPAVIQAYVNGVAVGLARTAPAVGGKWVSSSGNWDSGTATTATFTLVDKSISEARNDFVLDDISFTDTPGPPPPSVPEPSTWAMMLVGLGAVGAVIRARRRRARFAF